jgi:holo-[acyl-carrier protein] synthase
VVIVGIGTDVVDIPRIERMLADRGDRARHRLFTDAELAYAEARARVAQHLAVRLAAKEAAFKAFAGTDDARAIGWREIEVITHDDGRPALVFHGRARERATELAVTRAWVSLSHGDHTAHAMVVLERDA